MPFDTLSLARVAHVIAVTGWVGGVWFVTYVVMPAISQQQEPQSRLAAFQRIEQRFAGQARLWVLLAGASGFWMLWRADLWWRFGEPAFWWMHAMVALWGVFALMLFVIEPLHLHRRMASSASPAADFRKMVAAHRILSLAALLTIAAAMAGSHGLI